MNSKANRMVDAKQAAQKIAFSPFTFHSVIALLELGILKIVDDAGKAGIKLSDISKQSKVGEYAVSVLVEAGISAEVLSRQGDKILSTKTAQCFLYDETTRININFIKDVCYKGAFYLTDSLRSGKPEGLKVFGDWKTIYEGLSELPAEVKKSWFAFDHFYSDDSFAQVLPILLKNHPKRIFDIGCNTGKFECSLFAHGYKGEIVMIDLPQQLQTAFSNLTQNGFTHNFSLCPMDIVDKNSILPDNPDIIFMSQFLDCFSKEQITAILKKVSAVMSKKTICYILEPFFDKQTYPAAVFSLTHISLYFTAMANGQSKMYQSSEMIECINEAGLAAAQIHNKIGNYEYTLIEAVKKAH